jgi:DNA-binding MarR family transcriptional regulator
MKDQNNTNQNNSSTITMDHCPMCPNHCPAGSPKCGRGERYFAGGGQTAEVENGDNHEHSHGDGENHEHGHGGRHGHGDGETGGRGAGGRYGHGDGETGGHGAGGRHGHGHGDAGEQHSDEQERNGRSYDEMFERRDDLYGLMRQCGHHLYHDGIKSAGQDRILEILQKNGEMSQKDLQEMLQIKSGSISEIIGKMEAKGLLARTRDNADQRCVMLAITEDGLDRYRERKSDAEKERVTVFDALTQEEQDQLKTLLAKLTESWKEKKDHE